MSSCFYVTGYWSTVSAQPRSCFAIIESSILSSFRPMLLPTRQPSYTKMTKEDSIWNGIVVVPPYIHLYTHKKHTHSSDTSRSGIEKKHNDKEEKNHWKTLPYVLSSFGRR